MISLNDNGTAVSVEDGSTVLDACTTVGVSTPTLCYGPTVTPVNACRLCVVEVEGSRTLVPACSRAAEPDMIVSTETDRVRHSRKLVLELLGSASDLSQAEGLRPWMDEYDADPSRFGEGERIQQPVRVQDNLYIRDYDKCVQCYKCVEACGDDAQHTYAISMSGRGFATRVSTEFDVALPESACVYCGNCIEVCPTNALQVRTEYELRLASQWRPEEQTVTRTVCSYCGVGCNLELHVQDERIVKVSSPSDHDITSGNLCVKGRFGWRYVQPVD